MNEIEVKEQIISKLREKELVVKKIGKTTSDQFIRGYIDGVSEITGVDIPCHWYQEIISSVHNE